MAHYRQALALHPKYPETHYNLGVSLAAMGDMAGAIKHYEQALQFEPDYPE
jgi:tetratricopeptide (TPR) repeat protein